jgi:hypothetical protein
MVGEEIWVVVYVVRGILYRVPFPSFPSSIDTQSFQLQDSNSHSFLLRISSANSELSSAITLFTPSLSTLANLEGLASTTLIDQALPSSITTR